MTSSHQQLRVCIAGLFCLALAGVPSAELRAAQPGELFEWAPTGIVPAQTLRFRYCPAGTIRPGRPARDGGGSASTLPPTALRGFYLGEAEVTLAQFRAVLGEPGVAALKQEAAKFQAMNPQLFALVQQGEQEPAFFVRLEGAIQFCLHLQSAEDESRLNQIAPTIESRRLRLPSHIEWQYGARAIADAGQQSRFPHFNREFKFEELSAGTKEKCREVWSKLGDKSKDPFVGSQEQLLELTAAVGPEEQAKVKEVLSEWFTKLLGVPPRKVGGFADVRRVGQAPANAWGIYDCHDNVTEWVIWGATSERRDELWHSLTAKVASGASLDGQGNLFLAGGFFGEEYHGEKRLAHFALWGGPKLTDGIPQPFEYDPSLVGEFNPGFRILLQRTIAKDWLFTLRRGLYSEGRWQPSAKSRLDESQGLLSELADANHPGKITVEFYRTLHGLETGESARAAQMFDRIALVKTDMPGRAKPNLAALLDDTPKPDVIVEAAPVNDDALFWRTLSVVQSAGSR